MPAAMLDCNHKLRIHNLKVLIPYCFYDQDMMGDPKKFEFLIGMDTNVLWPQMQEVWMNVLPGSKNDFSYSFHKLKFSWIESYP